MKKVITVFLSLLILGFVFSAAIYASTPSTQRHWEFRGNGTRDNNQDGNRFELTPGSKPVRINVTVEIDANTPQRRITRRVELARWRWYGRDTMAHPLILDTYMANTTSTRRTVVSFDGTRNMTADIRNGSYFLRVQTSGSSSAFYSIYRVRVNSNS